MTKLPLFSRLILCSCATLALTIGEFVVSHYTHSISLLMVANQSIYNLLTLVISATSIAVSNTHHAEGLVNPKVRDKKKVTDFGYPRACRFRKCQIENRSPKLARPTFFKTIFKFIKLAKIDRFSNFLWLFSRFSGSGTHPRPS
jgi:hypothetical protein